MVRYPLLLIVVLIPTVTFLMATHTFEVVIWAWIYKIVGAAPPGTPLVYFAFVNYTTLATAKSYLCQNGNFSDRSLQ